jgi:hypothetical protein
MTDEVPKFNLEQWITAYDRANTGVSPDNDPDGKGEIILNAVTALPQLHMSVISVQDVNDMRDGYKRGILDSIDSEMGDESTFLFRSEDKVAYFDLKWAWHKFDSLKEFIYSYAKKGDVSSILVIANSFPHHSQILSGILDDCTQITPDSNWAGYGDTSIGSLVSSTRGRREDLLPGILDYRDYLVNGDLDIDHICNVLLIKVLEYEAACKLNNIEYAHSCDGAFDTITNIGYRFGDEVDSLVRDRFYKTYLEAIGFISSVNKGGC